MLKDTDYYHLLENIKNNYWMQDFFKNCFEKIVHKAGELLGNKIADAVTKPNDDKILFH